MKKLIVIAGVTLALTAALFAEDLTTPWVAPGYASRKHNPISANKESVEAGKALFTQICFACHGTSGKGDGPAAASCLPQKPANFTNPKIWEQTDGALYWKISQGRGVMPKFEGALTPEQRWNVINYLRTTFGPVQQATAK